MQVSTGRCPSAWALGIKHRPQFKYMTARCTSNAYDFKFMCIITKEKDVQIEDMSMSSVVHWENFHIFIH